VSVWCQSCQLRSWRRCTSTIHRFLHTKLLIGGDVILIVVVCLTTLTNVLWSTVEKQRVTKITNKWTKETTIYNQLRFLYSSSMTVKDETVLQDHVTSLIQTAVPNCDFCSPLEMTAEGSLQQLLVALLFSFNTLGIRRLGPHQRRPLSYFFELCQVSISCLSLVDMRSYDANDVKIWWHSWRYFVRPSQPSVICLGML